MNCILDKNRVLASWQWYSDHRRANEAVFAPMLADLLVRVFLAIPVVRFGLFVLGVR